MAKSSNRSALQTFKNSQALLLLLAVFLIASLCYVHSLDFSVTCGASSAKKGRALLEVNPTNKQSTMKIHQDQTHFIPTTTATSAASTPARPATGSDVPPATASKDRQFRMAAHNVPSGPNPESNK